MMTHYGFTEEALDYIVHYDTHFSMGDGLAVSGGKEVNDEYDN